MKPSKISALAALFLCGFAGAEPQPQVKDSQLFGEWACKIAEQRDPIHTFAPNYIAFAEGKNLPAHLYVAYFERTLDEGKDGGKNAKPLRYREYYYGFWNIKDGNRVLLTLSLDRVERLYKPEDIKDDALRQEEKEYMDFMEESARKKSFKSTDMRVLGIRGNKMAITDDESLLFCTKQPESGTAETDTQKGSPNNPQQPENPKTNRKDLK